MIKIGDYYHKEVRTIISDMNTPLGDTIGNSLEVLEAVAVLKGEAPAEAAKAAAYKAILKLQRKD